MNVYWLKLKIILNTLTDFTRPSSLSLSPSTPTLPSDCIPQYQVHSIQKNAHLLKQIIVFRETNSYIINFLEFFYISLFLLPFFPGFPVHYQDLLSNIRGDNSPVPWLLNINPLWKIHLSSLVRCFFFLIKEKREKRKTQQLTCFDILTRLLSSPRIRSSTH